MVITDWRGEYYGNASLQGPAQVVRNDVVVDFEAPAGTSLAKGLPSQNWSARWSRTWTFDEGNYRFHLLVDDGARLWVGGRLLIDAWADGPARPFAADLYLKGNTSIQLDYYNRLGDARVRLNWERVLHYEGWIGSYYANRDLSGLPVFQRGDLNINFNWGTGSPRADLQADNFGVRWTQRMGFGSGGTFRFRIEADDGVRLWVDGNLIVDAWQDGPSTHDKLVDLSSGEHDVRLEYYEHLGDASVRLALDAVPPTPTATPTLTATPVPTKPPTATPLPRRPKLVLNPEAGPVGASFEAIGTSWPARVDVTLYLVQPIPENEAYPRELVARTQSGEDGAFSVQVTIPRGQGWEGLPAAIVLARSDEDDLEAEAEFLILPELRQIPFEPIRTEGERFRLPEPTYLILDNQEAWNYWFGEDRPSREPPVDWEREIVVGILLEQPGRDSELGISSIVQREGVVSVWLASLVPELEDRAREETQMNLMAELVRVPRRSLGPEREDLSELLFAFLDASGRLLAMGPSGELGTIIAPGLLERMPLRAPAGAETPAPGAVALGAEASPAPDSQPDAVEEPAAAELPSEGEPSMLESAGEPEAAAVAEAEEAAPEVAQEVAPLEAEPAAAERGGTTPFQWLWTGAGLALLIGGLALILVIVGVFAWQRLR